jgi:hypothetical protein
MHSVLNHPGRDIHARHMRSATGHLSREIPRTTPHIKDPKSLNVTAEGDLRRAKELETVVVPP